MRALIPALALVAGCGATTNSTLKVEDTLAVTSSLVAHAVNSADAMLNAKADAMAATDVAAARKFYDSYKPKIEKARQAVHTAQDVITDAEAERAKIPSDSDAKQFTAWLPVLSQALVALQQAYADLKGLVQK